MREFNDFGYNRAQKVYFCRIRPYQRIHGPAFAGPEISKKDGIFMPDSALLLMCVKIFFSRILDVSLGTVRMVLTVKEKHLFAALCGFLEVGIWFLIVREALDAAGSSLLIVTAYAGGFAAGTYLGGLLADKLISGYVEVRVITTGKDRELIRAIREAGYGMSVVSAAGSELTDEKYMLIIQIAKRQTGALKALVQQYDPAAFLVVDETKLVWGGFFKK